MKFGILSRDKIFWQYGIVMWKVQYWYGTVLVKKNQSIGPKWILPLMDIYVRLGTGSPEYGSLFLNKISHIYLRTKFKYTYRT